MEDLFMYGPPGVGIDDCKALIDDLQTQQDTPSDLMNQRPLYIPSPEAMLHATADPFLLSASSQSGQQGLPPSDNFNRVFGLNNNSWSPPSESDMSEQSMSWDNVGLKTESMDFFPLDDSLVDRNAQAQRNSALGRQGLQDPDISFPGLPLNYGNDASGACASTTSSGSNRSAASVTSPLSNSSSTKAKQQQSQQPPPSYYGHNVYDVLGNAVDSGIRKTRARKTKTSHNMIEKRYRNNINDRINILRDAVPSMREAAAAAANGGDGSALRLNKATVLTKAAEYIEQLKRRNMALQEENEKLRIYHAAATMQASFDGTNNNPQTVEGAAGQNGNGVPKRRPNTRKPSNVLSPVSQSTVPPQNKAAASAVANPSATTSSRLAFGGLAAAGIFANGLGGGLNNLANDRDLGAVPLALPHFGSMALGRLLLYVGGVTLFVISFLSVLTWHSSCEKLSFKQFAQQEHRRSAFDTAFAQLGFAKQTSDLVVGWHVVLLLLQLVIKCLLGSSGYNMLMNALSRSLSIQNSCVLVDQALDTQILGGDSEVTTVRIVYMLIRAALCSETPERLLLRSIHCAQLAELHATLAPVANAFSRSYWARAVAIAGMNSTRSHARPAEHVLALLHMSHEYVFDELHRSFLLAALRGRMLDDIAYRVGLADSQVHSSISTLCAFVSFKLQNKALRTYVDDVSQTDSEAPTATVAALVARARSVAQAGSLLQFRCEAVAATLGRDLESVNELVRVVRHAQRDMKHLPPYFKACVLLSLASRYAARPNAPSHQFAAKLVSCAPRVERPDALLGVAGLLIARRLAGDCSLRPNASLSDCAVIARQWLGSSDPAALELGVKRRRSLIDSVFRLVVHYGEAGPAS